MKFFIMFSTLIFLGCSTTHKIDRNDITAPYDGKRFSNLDNSTDKTFWDVWKWRLTSKKTAWPEWVETEQQTISHERVSGLSVTFINHSTFLIQTDNLNILTDPFFSYRASPFTWIGPKRVRDVGVRMEDLPPIDIILVSHNHYDHMDKPALKKLNKLFPDAVVYTALGNANDIKETGYRNVNELDWWEKTEYMGLTITFVPAKHFSARTLWDRNETLWGGFVLKGHGGNIYFAGDTAKVEHDTTLAEQFGEFELALIPIGAYEPRWFMKTSHTNPEEAVAIHKEINSNFSIGMHFGTVQLTDEGIDEPANGLVKARSNAGLAETDFIVPEFGQTYRLR
jgi:L-ascorbate metabolism protein UlaG (beta-lactamase superfamily)